MIRRPPRSTLFPYTPLSRSQRSDTLGSFGIRFGRHPAERPGSFALGQQFARIGLGDSCDERDGSRQVGHFGGNRKGGIHGNGHGQLASSTVINYAAFGGNFRGALLLVLRALLKISVTKNLEI